MRKFVEGKIVRQKAVGDKIRSDPGGLGGAGVLLHVVADEKHVLRRKIEARQKL